MHLRSRSLPLSSVLLIWSLACSAVPSAPKSPATGAPTPVITPAVAVGPEYDTTHVYVAPELVDSFAERFLATFGGASTKQVVVTVTPTPSLTSSQLLRTPVGLVSLFGFKTGIPSVRERAHGLPRHRHGHCDQRGARRGR